MVKNKKGQVTIFVVLALIIVVAVIAYFFIRSSSISSIPKEMQPVYNAYLSCIERHTEQGISLLGEQAGYIYADELDFVPGSSYMPFSSQLDFFGQPIPYWMYVSGNNVLANQKPTLSSMEKELERYLASNLDNCDLDEFYAQGFDVYFSEGDVNVKISEGDVKVSIDSPVRINLEEQTVLVNEQEISVSSKLGKFYSLATEVFDYEMNNMFLENYTIDMIRLYAPVDGADLGCAPKVFVKEDIKEDIVEAITANVGALKLRGDYYTLSEKENKYFITDIGRSVDEQVNFVYSPSWPTSIEIYGEDVAKPVGMQTGMGILGFCYVPYHFVYDVNFPVLIQFYDEEELFQFPIAVIVKNNQARGAIAGESEELIESEVCKYRNQDMKVSTYDLDLNPVEARLQFKCLSSQCSIGSSKFIGEETIFEGSVPQCVNGFILASAEGYADAKKQVSTNSETETSVVLKKLFNVSLDLGTVDSALVTFSSEDYSTAVFYPEMKNVQLVESYYNVSVYVYRNSSLTFPGSNEKKCVTVPASGVGSLFGLEEEKCFDINIPSSTIDSAVVGGGKTEEYITQGMLSDSKELNINIPLFSTPKSIEELQSIYSQVEESIIYLEFE
jgi:hypothetical protein